MTEHQIATGTSADEVNDIISDAAPGAQIIFETGTHVFEQTITIRRDDITITAQQDTDIVFQFDRDGNGRIDENEGGNGFEVLGFATGSNFVRKADRGTVVEDVAAGATRIFVSDTSQLEAGDVVHFGQRNSTAFLEELGGCEDGTPCYETALNRNFREFTTTVVAVNTEANEVLLADAVPQALNADDTPIALSELTEIRSDVTLSNLNISFQVLDPDTGALITPDANLFENTQIGFTPDSRPANAAVYIEGSTGLELRDIHIENAPSDGITARNSIYLDAADISVSGSFNKGAGGNGYGVNIYETFNSTFTGLDIFDVRHAVLFSAWNAESGNLVQINDTNRDVNFHGGPDSANSIIVDRAVLDYADAPNAWAIVSNGGRVVHQQTDIYGLGNVVTFAEASGSRFDETIFANDTGATLRGNDGDDRLIAGAGGDVLDGGTGDDTVSYEAANARVWVDLRGDLANTNGAAGDTLLSIENLVGSAFNDLLLGDDLSNSLSAGAGDDTLFGRGGNDALVGGVGSDNLHGQRGDDELWGGSGADTFHFDAAAGSDQVLDFETGLDRLSFERHAGVNSIDDLTVTTNGTGLTIEFDAGTVALWGVSDFGAVDLVF